MSGENKNKGLSFEEVKALYLPDTSAAKVFIPRYNAGFLVIERWQQVKIESDRFPGLEKGSGGIVVKIRIKEGELIDHNEQLIVAYFPERRFHVCGEYVFHISADDLCYYWGKPEEV